MTAFGTVFLVLVFLIFWRKVHIEYHTLLFKYKLYALRDKLRNLAIEGKIDSNNWIFDYYDNTLSKFVNQAYYVTLFRIVMLVLKNGGAKELSVFASKVNAEVEKIPELKSIQQEFVLACGKYIKEQHKIPYKCVAKPIIIPFIGGIAIFAKKFNMYLNALLVFPETSDSSRFVNA